MIFTICDNLCYRCIFESYLVNVVVPTLLVDYYTQILKFLCFYFRHLINRTSTVLLRLAARPPQHTYFDHIYCSLHEFWNGLSQTMTSSAHPWVVKPLSFIFLNKSSTTNNHSSWRKYPTIVTLRQTFFSNTPLSK